MINLHNVDCMAFMKDVPDGFYDLAIVDPPYGINAGKMNMGSNLSRSGDGYPAESTESRLRKKGRLNSGGGKLKNRILNCSECEWDCAIPSEQYFKELFRVSKNQIIWGMNYFPLPPTRCVICWDKMQPWENFSQFELAWTSFDQPAAMFRHRNTGGANEEKKIHPTQKPVALYRWLLMNYAKPGWKVLDTHLGSASSAIAAHDFPLAQFDGCEINPHYFDNAKKRYEQYARQLQFDFYRETEETTDER